MNLDISRSGKKGKGRSIAAELAKTALPEVVAQKAAEIFNKIPNLSVIKKAPRREAIFFCSHEAYHTLKLEHPNRRAQFTVDPEMLCVTLGYTPEKKFMGKAMKRFTHKTGYRHVLCEDTIEDFTEAFFKYTGLQQESLTDLKRVTKRVLERWSELREKVAPQVAAVAIVRYFLLINGLDLEKSVYVTLVKRKDVITKLSSEIGRIDSGM